jgi:hypothetical protein
MRRLGFAHVRSFTTPVTIGLFGSGCDEYVYRRTGNAPDTSSDESQGGTE